MGDGRPSCSLPLRTRHLRRHNLPPARSRSPCLSSRQPLGEAAVSAAASRLAKGHAVGRIGPYLRTVSSYRRPLVLLLLLPLVASALALLLRPQPASREDPLLRYLELAGWTQAGLRPSSCVRLTGVSPSRRGAERLTRYRCVFQDPERLRASGFTGCFDVGEGEAPTIVALRRGTGACPGP
jgi:hypothetical protein